MASAPLFLAMAAGILAAPTAAHAQSAGPDLDARTDLRDRTIDDRPTRARDFELAASAEGPAPIFRFAAELAGTATSNAFQSPDDEETAFALSPSLALSATPRTRPFGWTLKASAAIATDRYNRFADDLDESTATGGLSAKRSIWKDGTLALGWTATSAWDADFNDRSVTLQDYTARIDHSFTDRLSGVVSATYRASDLAGPRRAAVLGELAYEFPAKPLGATWSASQRVQAAEYRAGANDGRSDVFARTELTGAWEITPEVSAGVTARYAHNFSNRAARRTDTFELSPSVSYVRKF